MTQCKGDISHASKTAKITVFESPDVPLHDELLAVKFAVLEARLMSPLYTVSCLRLWDI